MSFKVWRYSERQGVGLEPSTNGGRERTLRLTVGLRDGSPSVADVVETVVPSGGRIKSLQEEIPSLADLFLQVTGDEIQPHEEVVL